MPRRAVNIPYGKGHLTFTPPPGVALELLESRKQSGLDDPRKALRAALAKPLASRSLSDLARGKKDATIVISDITRPVPNKLILSEILPILAHAGIPRQKITILIGTGTHRAAPPREIETLVSPNIARHYRVVNHDCARGNVAIGSIADPITRSSIPLLVDKTFVRAGLRVLTGLVEPHIFCGYSGGRKAILPGICGLRTIRRWHSPEIVAHPKSVPGVVEGNVAHRLTLEASNIVPAHFCVNVTLNREREVTGVFAGDDERVFHAAVRKVESYVLTKAVNPAKVVVTSSAGWPLDLTFYQAIKGLVAVLPIIAPGAIVVLAAEVGEGLGDAAFEGLIRRTRNVAEWSRRLRSGRKFQLGQWQWQRMGWTRARARVFLVSKLSAADARAAFTEPFSDLQAAVDEAVRITWADRIAAVPEGPYVVTRTR